MYTQFTFPSVPAAPSGPQVAIEALYATAYDLFSQDRFADAAAMFRIMIQVSPEDERGWVALGECHEQAGHKEIALELYGAGAVAAPSSVRCEIARFRLLYDLDRQPEADQAFDDACSIAAELDDARLIELTQQERRARP